MRVGLQAPAPPAIRPTAGPRRAIPPPRPHPPPRPPTPRTGPRVAPVAGSGAGARRLRLGAWGDGTIHRVPGPLASLTRSCTQCGRRATRHTNQLSVPLCSVLFRESLLSRTRHVKRNVKRWRGGQMMLRWVATGVLEAVKRFRRLKGCGDMPRLVSALRARDQRLGLGVSEVNVA